MKLTGAFAGRRNAAVGKAFYVRELRGQLLACKWPTSRGRNLHPTTLAQMEKFKQANKMAQFAPAAIQVAHRTMVEGTNLLPRDLMIASMYGRGFEFRITDQRRRYPVAARQDLSATLDILGALAGDIVARGPDLWERVRPSDIGQVLTSQGPGVLPAYQAPPGGGGGWTELEDTTLAVALAVGVPYNIAVPTTAKEIEISVTIPFHATGYRPYCQINGSNGTGYEINTWDSDIGTGLTAFEHGGVSTIRWLRNGNAPNDGPWWCEGRFMQVTPTSPVQFLGRAWGATSLMTTVSANWKNSGAAQMTTINFGSNQGVGLQIGTRILARAILPV